MVPLVILLACTAAFAAEMPSGVTRFLADQCLDCHQGENAEAGLDLEALPMDLSQDTSLQRWVRIWDRVDQGEMPPADYSVPELEARQAFLNTTKLTLHTHLQQHHATHGRVPARRLTPKQVERSLHSLLGIDIPLTIHLTPEPRVHRYSTIADGRSMSHFQLQGHLNVVDRALDEAFRRALSRPDLYQRNFDAVGLVRKNPKRRCREPEMREGQAVIWNGGVIFYGRIPATTAPHDGWYSFRLTVSALKPPETGGVWFTVRTGLCVSSAPLLTHVASFEATPEPQTVEFQAWLPRGHMLEIRPGDATLKKGKFAGGQIGTGEGEPQEIPGIAFDRLEMQQIHHGPDDNGIRRMLLDRVVLSDHTHDNEVATREPLATELDLERKSSEAIVEPKQSKHDAPMPPSVPSEAALEDLLIRFATRAYRQPVDVSDIASITKACRQLLQEGHDFVDALRFGYRTLLCSPRFVYLAESPGRLSPHAIAARLSYFLTGAPPDAELRSLANEASFAQASLDDRLLQEQTVRLLEQHGRQFIEDFAAEWLDLQEIDTTTPDRKIFRDFDAIVQQSMVEETHEYLSLALADNWPAARLIDSHRTFLNSRLARYYAIPSVTGDEMQAVEFTPEHARGGLLGQGALLKVTANGTNTSPVLRGAWVAERLLGYSVPPPPDNVSAIEPDIRGATTIREQLEKHRSDPSCAGCHAILDPPGFALENFDATGRWRDSYRSKRKKGKASQQIDASYVLPNGRKFANIQEFRRLVSTDARRIASSLVENLLVYATGAEIDFADRVEVDAILAQAAAQDFGVRSLILEVVTSPIFLHK